MERDYQELKGEVGLDHFEGRSWRGIHHRATLCMVAHGFLALRRVLFPPEQDAVDAAPKCGGSSKSCSFAALGTAPVPATGQRPGASSWALMHVTE
ncbi:hypothetical protein [Corallococcus sp. CA049B]|uniref:hypothetical protein n=1 Tax=Corallococcus sp. CA049B TaxID=2316730 RepID=UPI001F463FAA|nr:hypothetical protein [Corallococcus sp. CA049B]